MVHYYTVFNALLVLVFSKFSKVNCRTTYYPSKPLNSRSVDYSGIESLEQVHHHHQPILVSSVPEKVYSSHVQEHYSRDSKKVIVPHHQSHVVAVPVATHQVVPIRNQQGVIPHSLSVPVQEEHHHHSFREERDDLVKRPGLVQGGYGGVHGGSQGEIFEEEEVEKSYRKDVVKKPVIVGDYRYL